MDWTSIGFAFTAGVIAFFSPCAFPMLPGYISYYLGFLESKDVEDTKKNTISQVLKDGVIGGVSCALGGVTVLVAIGVGISLLGSVVRNLIKENVSLMELIVGIILIIMGIVMLLGIDLKLPFKIKKSAKGKGYKSLFIYGALYALAAAGCTAPIFISVMIRAFVSSTFVNGLLVFLSYAFGLGILLIIVTILIASAKEVMITKMKKIMPYVQKIGAAVLIIVGIWLIYYYLTIYNYI